MGQSIACNVKTGNNASTAEFELDNTNNTVQKWVIKSHTTYLIPNHPHKKDDLGDVLTNQNMFG